MAIAVSAGEMEDAACPICGGVGEAVYRQADYFCALPGEFGQRHCEECRIYFLSPRPTEEGSGAYYVSSYVPYQKPGNGLLERMGQKVGMQYVRRRIVERFTKGGKILDVGCGNGFFLSTLAGNWERHAMDVANYATLGPDVPFFEGKIDLAAPPCEGMDAVTMWHVFEHLYHPLDGLRNVCKLLKPGGFLFLAIPDLRCLERLLFGKYWTGWDPPRHIATYSREAMHSLLARAGLRIVDVVADHCNGAGIALNGDFALHGCGVQLKLRELAAIRLALTPWALLSAQIGLAPAKVYVAQR